MSTSMVKGATITLLLALLPLGCKEQQPPPSREVAPQKGIERKEAGLPPLADARPARLAGSWYAKDPAVLRAELTRYLGAAQREEAAKAAKGGLLGLVAPHAGYRFSGRTAASVYARLRAAEPRRVFVLGPSHSSRLRGVALVWARRFATPLGSLTIDTTALTQLARHPLFLHAPQVDEREHSVEMQMPYIRLVAPKARVVPLIVGVLTLHEVRRVADAIRRLLRPGDVVVASSDFTHYGPRFRYQPFGEPIEANLRRLDLRAYELLAGSDLSAFWRFKHETADTICGFYPASIVRSIVGDAKATLLRYDTSGKLEKSFENSVSYLAIAFDAPDGAPADWEALRRRRKPTQEFLSATAARRAVQIARRALEHHYKSGGKRFDARAAGLVLPGRLEQQHGVFVTLKRKADHSLRGCIGHVIGRMPLHAGIVENALNAALHDPRFSPVTREELAQLSVEITVLTPPRAVEGPRAITIGRDGIMLRKGDKQALFLPQVAVEQGWGLRRTLAALSRKAGLGPEGWRDAQYHVFRGYVYEEQADGGGH